MVIPLYHKTIKELLKEYERNHNPDMEYDDYEMPIVEKPKWMKSYKKK